MLKMILLGIGALVLLMVLLFIYESLTSKPVYTGVVDGMLGPCSAKPNCVCSEKNTSPTDKSFVMPFEITASTSDPINAMANLIEQQGGKIVERTDDYLRAEYTSLIFRFVDDLEIRRATQHSLLHVRSASRAGHSDLGVNRKRVEALRSKWKTL